MKPSFFKLPYPPSVNTVYRHAVRGKHSVMFMTQNGKDYIKTVKSLMINYGDPRFGQERVKVEIDVYPPDRRKRDLGNLDKVLMDSLQHARVFDDDGQIDDLHYVRKEVSKPGFVIVRITPINVLCGT